MQCVTDSTLTEPIRADRSYLVTGGTGGLGPHIAQWLAQRGARRIALLSRRAHLTPPARELVTDLRDSAVDIDAHPVDVTDEHALATFLDQWRDPQRPLAGIVHAAGIGHDRPLDELTASDFQMVMRPKLHGALALHQATLADPLDFFLLTSSVSAWTGTSGQSAYAAANAALDAFAQWRSRQGRPTASLALGPVADAGMAATSPQIVQYLDLLGYQPFPLDRLGDVLDRAVAWNRPQLGLFDLDWLQWSLAEPRAATSRRFDTLVANARGSIGKDAGALRAAIAALPLDDRIDTLATLVANELALVLGTSADDLDIDRSLHTLGLDSLMLVEVQTRLNMALGAELSLMGLLSRDTIRDVASSIDDAIR
jgi:NAD(P)-dependent dehydrogenase (short-subunit alcohol dehydrogenase family)/acyl carrier protein